MSTSHIDGRNVPRLRVLLTGATGFIGQHVQVELHDQQVTLLRRPEADLTDRSSLERLVEREKPDVVLHLAAKLRSETASWDYVRVNIEGTLSLLEACRTHRPAIVYASSMSVYDFAKPRTLPVDERHPLEPRTAYGDSKLAGEILCRAYGQSVGVGCLVLRLPGVYGPGRQAGLIHNLFDSALTQRPIVTGSLQTRRDFLYVKDAARAFRLAVLAAHAGRSGECNVAGTREPLARIVEAVSRVAGKAPVLTERPNQDNDFYFDGNHTAELITFTSRPLDEAIADYWNDHLQRSSFEPQHQVR